MKSTDEVLTKEYLDQILKEKFDKVLEKLDWLIGKYSAHEEEHTLLNNKVSEHSDNLEVINDKLGITL